MDITLSLEHAERLLALAEVVERQRWSMSCPLKEDFLEAIRETRRKVEAARGQVS